MKSFVSAKVFDIADPGNKRRLMRETLSALEPHQDLGFVMVHLVAAFIDGLAAGAIGNTKKAYLAYLEAHFPAMCQAIGAEVFYSHIRSKAVHEFAILSPFALAHSAVFSDPTAYTETKTVEGNQWTLINVERVLADFRSHLDTLEKVTYGKAMT